GLKNLARKGSCDSFEEISITSVVEDSLILLSHKCIKRGIELEIVPFNEATTLYCQRVQISQVLVILINNSIAALEEQPLKWIKVEVETFSSVLRISVTDSGMGIKSELGEKIFEPFFTTKKVGKGTG